MVLKCEKFYLAKPLGSLLEKLNRSPLNEVDEHIARLESYLDAAKEFEGEIIPEAQADVIDTLEYSVIILKQHKKNLLHCFAIAEKGKKN